MSDISSGESPSFTDLATCVSGDAESPGHSGGLSYTSVGGLANTGMVTTIDVDFGESGADPPCEITISLDGMAAVTDGGV